MTTGQSAFDTEVRLAIQRGFLDGGSTPSVASIATALGVTDAVTAGAFERLATGHVIVLVPGTLDIMMSAPFAGRRTDFSVRTGSRTYDANCVWDALGIAAMLAGAGQASDATVATACADCDAPLTIMVRDGVVTTEPPRAVAHFAVPAARWWDDIGFT